MVNEIHERFQNTFLFRFVYIAEAHAMDEWPVTSERFSKSGPIIVNQPKNSYDRCFLAQRFQSEYDLKMDLIIDIPENGDQFEKLFAPWPLRFYLLSSHNELKFVAEPVDCSFETAFVQLIGHLESYELINNSF